MKKQSVIDIVTVLFNNPEALSEIIDGFDHVLMTDSFAADKLLNGAYKAQCALIGTADEQKLNDVIEYLEWACQQASEYQASTNKKKKKKTA